MFAYGTGNELASSKEPWLIPELCARLTHLPVADLLAIACLTNFNAEFKCTANFAVLVYCLFLRD